MCNQDSQIAHPKSKNQYELVLIVTFINDAIILGKLQSKTINPQKFD